MSVSDHNAENATTSEKPKTIILGGISALWIAGMAALTFTTAPSNAALHTSAPVAQAEPINIAVSSSHNVKPATVTTETAAVAVGDIAKIPKSQTVDFIVRFKKNIPELDKCSKMFRGDKAAARKLFSEWAASKEALDGIRLKKVSYSGEMILVWNIDTDSTVTQADVQAKLDQINSMADVRYADADSTVKTQEGQ